MPIDFERTSTLPQIDPTRSSYPRPSRPDLQPGPPESLEEPPPRPLFFRLSEQPSQNETDYALVSPPPRLGPATSNELRAGGRQHRAREAAAKARDCDHNRTYTEHRDCVERWGRPSEIEAWHRREATWSMFAGAATAGLSARLAGARLQAEKLKPVRTYPLVVEGRPEAVHSQARATQQADIAAQNRSAELLARRGFAVEHNRAPLANGKEPDFILGVRPHRQVWDHYNARAPTAWKVRQAISAKVKAGQTNRVVVRLDDSPVSARELIDLLEQRPKQGLEELIIVEGDQLHHVKPGAPVVVDPPVR